MDTSVRVLLVDDEPGIRHVLGALIRDFGYDVHTAESAREALEAFTANPFPIVVTDIRMPGMDGLALLERVRNQNPDTQVVMITGHGDMDNAVECLRLGAADFIAKPVNDDLLEHSLKRAAEQYSLREQNPPPHRTPGGARRLAHAGTAGSPPGRRRGRNRGLYGPHHQKPRGGARREPLCPQAGDGVREPGVSRRRLGHARRRHFAGARQALAPAAYRAADGTARMPCGPGAARPPCGQASGRPGRQSEHSAPVSGCRRFRPHPSGCRTPRRLSAQSGGQRAGGLPRAGAARPPRRSPGSRSPARPTPSSTTCGTTARG